MAKTVLDLTEMHDADVKFISLVKRGANKIPFRIIKSEDAQMGKKLFNLETLFSARKAAEVVPAIVGFAVAKSDQTAGYVEALEQKGYKFTQEDVDGGVVCTIKSVDPEAVTTIKVNDDVAVMVEGVKKGFYGHSDSTDFSEKMATDGFYSSLYTAMSVLGDTVCTAMYKAESEAPIASIQKAFQDAQNYVTSLVNAIPVDCFKLEKLEPVAKKPVTDGSAADEEEVECKACGSKMKKGGECKACGKVKKDDPAPEDEEDVEKADSKKCPDCGATCALDASTCKSCGAKMNAKKEDEVPPVDVVKTVTDMLTAFTATMTAKMDEGFAAIQKTADEAKELAKKSDDALSNVLVGSIATGTDSVQKAVSSTPKKAIFDDVLKFDGFEGK